MKEIPKELFTELVYDPVEDWAKAKREELHGQYANHT